MVSAKKIIAVGIAGLMGVGLAMAGSMTTPVYGGQSINLHDVLKPTDTAIVLPTVIEVNGTPVHIKDDAVMGARLAVDLLEHNPVYVEKKVKENVTVSVRSLYVKDDNQTWVLSPEYFSELNLPTSVSVEVNFSKIEFNTTTGKALLHNNAIVIKLNSNIVKLYNGNDTIYSFEENGTTYVRLYNITKASKPVKFSSTFTEDGFSVTIVDYSTSTSEYLDIVSFGGKSKQLADIKAGVKYLVYVDKDLIVVPMNETLMNELIKEGKEFAIFESNTPFIGIDGNRIASITAEVYKPEKTYYDGQHWDGLKNWVIHIETPVNNTIPFSINYYAGNTTNSTVAVTSVELPLFELAFHVKPVVGKDGKVTGAEYYFTQETEKEAYVTIKVPVMNIDPNAFIVKDSTLANATTLPDENLVVVGGWVSNRFWGVLKKYYPSEVAQMEKEVMDDGYVIEVLKNPAHPDKYIVVVAGKTHVQTAEAIEKLMEMLDES